MSWDLMLKLGHIIGTVLGAGGATFAEIFYLQSLANKSEHPDNRFFGVMYTVLRVGLVLVVLSGFGYFILFRFEGHEERLYNPRYWAKMIITVIILVNAILLQVRKIPMWLGSALSLTSWYAALILGAWRGLDASFLAIITAYTAAVFVVAFVLHMIKKKITSHA